MNPIIIRPLKKLSREFSIAGAEKEALPALFAATRYRYADNGVVRSGGWDG
ncbi:hypothetical protein [Methylomonas koyamae]|uniref:hypothetical protein n=1 Tax=Methylomonas koyamae TaxID=702114 RepID=UPI0016431A4B|nr:hypothetical protein [Methylomonas koyamae]